MKVEKDEALRCLRLLEALIGPTIRYLEGELKEREQEFEVKFGRERAAKGNNWVVPEGKLCRTPATNEDYRRLAAASILLARFLEP